MLSPKEYDLRPIEGMPSNIVVGVGRDWLAEPNVQLEPDRMKLRPKLRDFILPFIKAHPDWRFETRYNFFGTKQLEDIRVFKGDEELGNIGLMGRSEKFYISSPKIREGLERGGTRETKDEKKARKYLETFEPKSTQEKALEARGTIDNAMDSLYRQARNDYRRAHESFNVYIRKYIEDNIEQLLIIAKANGMTEHNVENFTTYMDTHRIVEGVYSVKEQHKGEFVLIEDGRYIVCENDPLMSTPTAVVYHSDNLPDHLRRGIGMLKLSQDKNFVTGVGFRYSEHKFFVLKEQGV
jgi:hypothetical protein